jgi:hypothetical protein
MMEMLQIFIMPQISLLNPNQEEILLQAAKKRKIIMILWAPIPKMMLLTRQALVPEQPLHVGAPANRAQPCRLVGRLLLRQALIPERQALALLR